MEIQQIKIEEENIPNEQEAIPEINNQDENINHISDIQPNQTIYVNNLNEKIKNDGKNFYFLALF